jgi:hypothetical protein
MLDFTIWGFQLNLHLKHTSPELANVALFRGVYSRVARKLCVTPQHVRRVAVGLSVSKRVAREIEREIRRIKDRNRELAA